MQLVANIRRYKGIMSPPAAGTIKTVRSFADWNDVKPVYIDYVNDTQHRNHPGAELNPPRTYTNNTGRNDFYILKVARDKKNLYFYAETADNISKDITDNWMRLYINSDRKHDTGWNGYDFRINAGTQLQKWSDAQWITIGHVTKAQENNKLMYSFPAEDISLNVNALDFEFKWSDNMQDENDPLDWYVNGDAAPGGRFNFVYKVK